MKSHISNIMLILMIVELSGGCAASKVSGRANATTNLNETDNLSEMERSKLEQRAVTLNDAEASYRLANYYDFIRLDHKKTMFWLRKAAEAGYPMAEYDLAVKLSQSSKPKDRQEATIWFKKATAKGIFRPS